MTWRTAPLAAFATAALTASAPAAERLDLRYGVAAFGAVDPLREPACDRGLARPAGDERADGHDGNRRPLDAPRFPIIDDFKSRGRGGTTGANEHDRPQASLRPAYGLMTRHRANRRRRRNMNWNSRHDRGHDTNGGEEGQRVACVNRGSVTESVDLLQTPTGSRLLAQGCPPRRATLG